MNCTVVERWLDEGMPATGAAAARAHAARCPVCAPRLAASERVEAMLAAAAHTVPAAPAGFADRVMARVAGERATGTAPAAFAATATPAAPASRRIPWWLWVGADPAIPLALAFASAAFGLGRAALIFAQRPLAYTPPSIDLGALGSVLGERPFTQVVVAVTILPLIVLASMQLFHATQRVVRARALRP